LITLLSIFVKVVYLTPDFLAKSSCDKPVFVQLVKNLKCPSTSSGHPMLLTRDSPKMACHE
jgi:hypothetical protein